MLYGILDGKYFYFSKEEFSKMVGNENWNEQEFEIVQEGSHSWEGKVVVYKSVDRWNDESIYGRKADGEGAADGDWKTSDTITLKRCIDPGKNCSIRFR